MALLESVGQHPNKEVRLEKCNCCVGALVVGVLPEGGCSEVVA